MKKQYDVITFGDMCVDLIMSGGDIVPRFGQVEQLVGDYTLEMGGSACIFACQAARLALRTGILGKVGPDGFGGLTLDRLQACGVDIRHVSVDPDLKTGLGVALCKDNDRAILTYLGSLDVLTLDDVSEDYLNSSRHLHHGSYFLQSKLKPAIPEIFKTAKALELTVSLDTNWDPDESWNGTLKDSLAYTDLFFPNLQELKFITQTGSLEDGVRAVHDLGVGIVAVKLGEKGACLSDGNQTYSCLVTAVSGGDSVGAGDSFDAGFLAGYLHGLPLPDCLRLACGCGRSVASKVGGLDGQLDWQRLFEFSREIPVTEGLLL